MAEPLKNQFGPEIPRKIAERIAAVYPEFKREAFIREALAGYEPLDLLARGRKIAKALRSHLPADYEKAIAILIASLGPKLETTDGHGMAPFLYLPVDSYIAAYGLDFFEASLAKLTTRRHHPGRHAIDLVLNGRVKPLGEFTLANR